MTLEVIEPGFLTTIQDMGRYGFGRFGVPISGATDRFALAAANLLVRNDINAAGLEMTAQGPVFLAWHDTFLALSGGGFSLEVDGQVFPAWMSVFVRAGSVIRLLPNEGGTWGYLAFGGGIQTTPVMGSRSTYLRGGFGGLEGRALQIGDLLPIQEAEAGSTLFAGNVFEPHLRPVYLENPILRMVTGMQVDAFTLSGLRTFLEQPYTLTLAADRMGYRFDGPPIEHLASADILSDGLVIGAVQVPANGQPIVMMSDCQTTGGYTKIGAVIQADLPVLAQCRPGVSRVQFKQVTLEEAQHAACEMRSALEHRSVGCDEDSLLWACC